MPLFSQLHTELRLFIWKLCEPRRNLTLDIPLDSPSESVSCESVPQGVVWIELSRQQQDFLFQQHQVSGLSGVCRESRSVVLTQLADRIKVCDETVSSDPQRPRGTVRCDLRNDIFTIGQLSSTPCRRYRHQMRAGFVTQKQDDSLQQSQQLQCIRTLGLSQQRHEMDIVGMKRADGRSLGSCGPELADCASAMRNLRLLVVPKEFGSIVHPPRKAQTEDQPTRRSSMVARIKQCLGLEQDNSPCVVCLDS
jgi:hypothetical protein